MTLVLSNVKGVRAQFAAYDFAEFAELDWTWSVDEVAQRVFANVEVLCLTSDNGPPMLTQCAKIVAAIRLTQLKYVYTFSSSRLLFLLELRV